MIILIGFPKSGTSSFYTLFNNLGYISAQQMERPGSHQNRGEYLGKLIYKAKNEGKELLYYIKKSNLEAISQLDVCHSESLNYWPQLLLYKDLYFENPNAIFILNKREPNSLLNSLNKWGDLIDRIFKFNPELFEGVNGDNRNDKLLNLIKNHYTEVNNFFVTQNPNSNYIEYDIVNDDIRKLSTYINLKDINKFPHKNINK